MIISLVIMTNNMAKVFKIRSKQNRVRKEKFAPRRRSRNSIFLPFPRNGLRKMTASLSHLLKGPTCKIYKAKSKQNEDPTAGDIGNQLHITKIGRVDTGAK